MPRSKAILQNEFPYHVSARCLNKEWFKISMDKVWNIYSRQLTFISWAFKAEIISFVLMNSHFHLLIITPEANLSKIMANFMRETARYLNEQTGRINQVYGARHYRCVIGSPHYFMHAYKYVYRNPVQADLSKNCESYKYSSLSFLMGSSYASFPTIEDFTLFNNPNETLEWLNRTPPPDHWEKIGQALQKSNFKIAKEPTKNRPHTLENNML